MKKLFIGLIILNISFIAYAINTKFINCKITYSIKENKILTVVISSKDQLEIEKCSKQIRSKEALELFKKQHENYKERDSALILYTCVLT